MSVRVANFFIGNLLIVNCLSAVPEIVQISMRISVSSLTTFVMYVYVVMYCCAPKCLRGALEISPEFNRFTALNCSFPNKNPSVFVEMGPIQVTFYQFTHKKRKPHRNAWY